MNTLPNLRVASNNRLRGFFTDDVVTCTGEIHGLEEYMADSLHAMEHIPNISRLNIRAVMDAGLLACSTAVTDMTIEAAMPIRNTGLAVVYFGSNKPERLMADCHIGQHTQLLESAVRRQTLEHDITPNLLTVDPNDTDHLVPDFIDLYDALNFDRAETESLLSDRLNTVVYIDIEGRAVSTAMAERENIEIQGYGTLNLVEVTEASTLPQYRGKGLYRAVSRYLLDKLLGEAEDNPSGIDVIYGESNLAMPGVVYAAQANGRRFNHFDRADLNIDNRSFGILPQNFSVNDGVETRRYNDFALSYVPLGGCDV